jgi:hypothetical protein
LSDKEHLPGEKVSYNSKAVLLGLFALVGFVLLVFSISANIFSPDQTGRLTTVFVAAISGTLALGGTLITQLWGKDTGNRPNIYRTDPEDTATGVPVDTPIRATFNKLMNSSTINSQTFTLKDDTNSNLEGTVTLEGGNAIFKPSTSNPLKPLTKYTATITKDVKDITGNSLEDDKVWSFTTGNGDATPAPSNNSPKVKDQKTS